MNFLFIIFHFLKNNHEVSHENIRVMTRGHMIKAQNVSLHLPLNSIRWAIRKHELYKIHNSLLKEILL